MEITGEMTSKEHRIALGIEYLGTNFKGIQHQPQQRTVQSTVEDALSSIASERIAIVFAGRTDAGVHATNQVVSFSTTAPRDSSAWLRGTNSLLPNDVRVHTVQTVDESFDPRRSVRWRRYMYVIGESQEVPAIGRELAYWIPFALDVERMNESAQCLLGEQDFSSFRASQCGSLTPIRFIHSVSVRRISDLVVVDIVANAFLLRMARNIVSSLIGVSRGDIDDLEHLLQARDRTIAPSTAPTDGLYLVQVAYSEYPGLGDLHVPRLLGPSVDVQVFSAMDFPDARPTVMS